MTPEAKKLLSSTVRALRARLPGDLQAAMEGEYRLGVARVRDAGLGEAALKILDLGCYEPACAGLVPSQVREKIEADGGIGGNSLLAHFGAPPYGYTINVIKACTIGLLRAGKVRIHLTSQQHYRLTPT